MSHPASPVTIRQQLRNWFRFLGSGVIAVGIVAGFWHPTWANHILRMVTLGFLLFCVAGLFVFGFRCARCEYFLIHKAHLIVGTHNPYLCPRCGADIDRP